MFKKMVPIVTCIIIVCFAVLAKRFYGESARYSAENPTALIIHADGTYSAALRAIIQKTGVSYDGTLEDLVKKTQRSQIDGGWLRPVGKERWELPFDKNVDVAWYIKQFSKMGFIDGIMPCKQEYTYALILGATIQGMRARFAYLLYLIMEHGLKVKHIIFLVGQRPRDVKQEADEILFNQENSEIPFNTAWMPRDQLPATETELAHLIIAQSDIPADIRECISVVDTPMVVKNDGTTTRPTTEDTIISWLATNPELASILCISSQPHTIRQWCVVRRVLPAEWPVECVGRAMRDPDINVYVLLDTLARTLWEILKSPVTTVERVSIA